MFMRPPPSAGGRQADHRHQDRQVAAIARQRALPHRAIAGDYGAYLAMCERYGIVTCPTLDDMVETMLAFQNGRLPKGRASLGDHLGRHRRSALRLSRRDRRHHRARIRPRHKAKVRHLVSPELALNNPLDAGNPTRRRLAELCRGILADPMSTCAGAAPCRAAAACATHPSCAACSIARQAGDRFVRMSYPVGEAGIAFQDQVGFPYLQGLPETARALAAMVFYAARKGRAIVRRRRRPDAPRRCRARRSISARPGMA